MSDRRCIPGQLMCDAFSYARVRASSMVVPKATTLSTRPPDVITDRPDPPAPGAGGSGRSVITSGGRVLNVVALGTTIEEARTRAYEKASHISWPGMQRRSDIAGSGSFEASGTLTGPGPGTGTVSGPGT